MINMKIIVNQKTLNDVLKDISKINKRSNVKIVTNNDCVELIATHNYISHTFKLDSVILQQGEFKLTLDSIINIVDMFEEGKELTLIVKDDKLFIENSFVKFVDFPEVVNNSVDIQGDFRMPGASLKKAINKVKHAISKDETKMIICGVLFKQTENGIDVVSVDGYRMVVHTIEDVDMNGLDDIVIYGEDLKITEKFIKKNSNDLIKINVYSDRVEFILDNKKLSARIIEGEFIGYNKLIPDNHTTEFKANTKDIKDKLSKTNKMKFKNKYNLVNLYIRQDKIDIKVKNEEQSVETETYINDFCGDILNIAFNNKYLLDIFKVIDDKEVYIGLTTNVSQILIEEIDTKYTLLPIRVCGEDF